MNEQHAAETLRKLQEIHLEVDQDLEAAIECHDVEPCPLCFGSGQIEDSPCTNCNGEGVVYVVVTLPPVPLTDVPVATAVEVGFSIWQDRESGSWRVLGPNENGAFTLLIDAVLWIYKSLVTH